MSDLTKILAENQKEMLKPKAPPNKKPISSQNLGNTDSEPENVFPTNTSTPIRSKATTQKATPVNNRNISLLVHFYDEDFNDDKNTQRVPPKHNKLHNRLSIREI